MITKISCLGFIGFGEKQSLDLAVPDGSQPGSGLTILVGPNGGGKSTLVECFHQLSLANRNVTFSEGKRNKHAGGIVEISIDYDGTTGVLRTLNRGAQTKWSGPAVPLIYYLPSRRFFNPFFGMMQLDRETYLRNQQNYQFRTNSLDQYTSRLVDLNLKGAREFNEVLGRIIGEQIEWTIDQGDGGQQFVKITKSDGVYHNSDGLGEGILSLMFIVDALCGRDDELVVIDEPELSLHPQLQKRLLQEIMERSKHRQIVISTHSPNMVSLKAIVNGAMIARVYNDGSGSRISMIDDESRQFVKATINNLYNPHVLGLDARSCFFAEDNIIITEGQEDVILYPEVLEQLEKKYEIPFFGFGAGGALSIRSVAHMLQVLGFKHIGAIYDGDKEKEFKEFNKVFKQFGYKAWMIPANDIRDKKAQGSKAEVKGLLTDRKELKKQYYGEMSVMFKEIHEYLTLKEE